MKPLLPLAVEKAIYEVGSFRLLLACPADSAAECYEQLNHVLEHAQTLKSSLSVIESFLREQYALCGCGEHRKHFGSIYGFSVEQEKSCPSDECSGASSP